MPGVAPRAVWACHPSALGDGHPARYPSAACGVASCLLRALRAAAGVDHRPVGGSPECDERVA